MRLVRSAVVLCALVACGHSSTTGSNGGSAEPAHWAKAGPAPVAAALTYPLELAVGGGRVWVVTSDRDVTLIEKGASRVVKSFGWVHAIAADEQGVWVAADDELGGKTSALWRILPTGEATRVVEDIKYVVRAGTSLLVWRGKETFVRDASGAERSLGALDGTVRVVGEWLYVVQRSGEISRLPLNGGARETIGDLGDLVESFDVSGDTIYASVDRGIWTMSIRGGVRQKLVENLDDPRELLADGQGGVYVLTYGTHKDFWGHSSNNDGELLHVEPGGRITALASEFIGAGRIGLTAETVYVTDVYGGRVLAIPR
jgi:hypothetical protein